MISKDPIDFCLNPGKKYHLQNNIGFLEDIAKTITFFTAVYRSKRIAK